MRRNDSASATIAALEGAAVAMNGEIKRRGNANITAAATARKPIAIQNAVQPASEIAARSRAPNARPTRTLAACPRPSGTMNVVEAILMENAGAFIVFGPVEAAPQGL